MVRVGSQIRLIADERFVAVQLKDKGVFAVSRR
jgi:hypothetical protein